MPRSKLSPRRVAAMRREAEAMELRTKGLTFEEIARRTGYWANGKGARKAVERALARHSVLDADIIIRTSMMRLEEMVARLWSLVELGDVEAIDRVLKIIDRQVKLVAPTTGGAAAQVVVNATANASAGAAALAAARGESTDPELPASVAAVESLRGILADVETDAAEMAMLAAGPDVVETDLVDRGDEDPVDTSPEWLGNGHKRGVPGSGIAL